MWIVQLIFLCVGISSLRQLTKVKRIDASDYPLVPEDAVLNWKRSKLTSLRLYIFAGIWMVVLPMASMLISLIPTVDGGKSVDPSAVIFNYACVVAMFIFGIVGFIFESKARRIAKDNNLETKNRVE